MSIVDYQIEGTQRGSGSTHILKKERLSPDYIYVLEELTDSIEHGGLKAVEKMVDLTHTGYKKPHSALQGLIDAEASYALESYFFAFV